MKSHSTYIIFTPTHSLWKHLSARRAWWKLQRHTCLITVTAFISSLRHCGRVNHFLRQLKTTCSVSSSSSSPPSATAVYLLRRSLLPHRWRHLKPCSPWQQKCWAAAPRSCTSWAVYTPARRLGNRESRPKKKKESERSIKSLLGRSEWIWMNEFKPII